MKIATSELKHLREEVKNCHRIIKDLQKKREFVGLTDEEMKKIWYAMQNIMGWYSFQEIARAIEAAHGIKEKNT